VNKKELELQRDKIWKRYHVAPMANYCKRKKNAIFISTANNLKHEIAKLEVCYLLRKQKQHFITEATRNNEDIKIDVVVLDTGEEIEICHKNKKADTLSRYKEEDVIVIHTDKPVKKQLDAQRL